MQTIKNKLKALKCSTSKINLELCNILLTYRKTVHPATGKSPSMLVFGRQIRSRLDLLIPTQESLRKAEIPVRSFQIGARVRVRDFLSHDKWKFGKISARVGKLRYEVKLDDGRVWERHIDHIAEVGADLRGTSAVNQENDLREQGDTTYFEEVLPSTSNANTAVTTSDSEITVENTPGSSDRDADRPVERNNDPGMERDLTPAPIRPINLEEESVLRRSTRARKPPQRLNL